MLLLPLLFACEQIKDIKDTVQGLTNPLVVEAIYLGVQPPDVGSGIDLSGSDFARGSTLKAFLADAADADGLDEAPLAGAELDLVSAANGGRLPLQDQGDGSYTANESEDGLAYASESVSLSTELDEKQRTIGVQAPPPADVTIADRHTAGQPMVVDISDQDFDGLLVFVMGSGGSEPRYSNMPESIQDLYEFTHGGGELRVEIPASAFPSAGVYAVGVAATRNSSADEMEEVNTALSSFVAGKARFHAVVVE